MATLTVSAKFDSNRVVAARVIQISRQKTGRRHYEELQETAAAFNRDTNEWVAEIEPEVVDIGQVLLLKVVALGAIGKYLAVLHAPAHP